MSWGERSLSVFLPQRAPDSSSPLVLRLSLWERGTWDLQQTYCVALSKQLHLPGSQLPTYKMWTNSLCESINVN